MSRTSALCLVCGLLAVSCVSAAPRSEGLVDDVTDIIKKWVTSSVQAKPPASACFLGEDANTPFHVLMKCKVPPVHHKEFAQIWLDTQQRAEGKHGNKVMSLFKIHGDSTVFLAYFEWDDRRAFHESCTLKEFTQIMEFVKDKDITVTLSGMTPVEEMSEERSAGGSPSHASAFDLSSFMTLDEHMVDPSALEAALAGDSKDYKPVLLSKICVRPSKQEDFISTFLDTKETMLKEEKKAVEDVCLAKTHNDNVCFLGYEKWESQEKLREHFESAIHKDWTAFVHENNIASKVCMAVEVTDMSPFDY